VESFDEYAKSKVALGVDFVVLTPLKNATIAIDESLKKIEDAIDNFSKTVKKHDTNQNKTGI
jgi:hypothetical protein